MSIKLPDYPVLEALPALRKALRESGTAVLSAPPGSGKTTLVPLALLDEPWLADQRIVMLEPRRVAARLSARRMATLLNEPVGQRVGYQVRFEKKSSRATCVEVLTEGLLTRRLQTDPELPGTGLLIFDEFHERSLDADLALALALESRAVLKPALRIIVMSATLETQRLSELLGGAPVIEASGKMFPVSIRHVESASPATVADAVSACATRALQAPGGDILAFLPGAREIGQAQRALESQHPTVAIRPLYGQLPTHAQDRALAPDLEGRRRVILATNIAQTSLTVEGVDTVIDGGYTRAPVFDPGAGANRLDTQRVSRATAEQRAGRAGRLGPGTAWRLWSSDQHGALEAQDAPEILRADLSGFVLQLAAFGHGDPAGLSLLDAPPEAHWAWASELLRMIGALDATGRITTHGRRLAALPLAPRLGHLMCLARDAGLAQSGAWLAASLELQSVAGETDLFRHVTRLRRESTQGIERTVEQLLRAVGENRDTQPSSDEAVARLVAQAFPERLARRREGLRERAGARHTAVREVAFQCTDGGEARVPEQDPLARSEWLAIAHWTPGSQRRVRLACPIAGASVLSAFDAQLSEADEVHWDDVDQRVVSRRVKRLGRLALSERRLEAEPEALCRAMLEGVRKMGLEALPWTETCRQWQARVMSLRAWQPEARWPDVSHAALMARLDQWLAPFLSGISRRAHLDRLDLFQALQAGLDYTQQQALSRLAPTQIEVPSGRRMSLAYSPDAESPELEVKLQEMFGCRQTPSVCDGRVAVRLQLLSPAARPIAVTRDIAGFWQGGYHEVRKELRGRYPKHPWPEDPLTAPPTHRAKPRKT